MLTEHRNHMPAPEEFDFSVFDEIFEKFPSFCDPEEIGPFAFQEGIELMLKPDAVLAYLQWCLTKPEKFNLSREKPEEMERIMTPDLNSPNHKRYLKDAFVIGQERLMGTLPLSEQEHNQAIYNIKETPELYRASMTFRDFIREYLMCLSEKARESELYSENASEFVQESLRFTLGHCHNAIRAGFSIEFIPLLGLNIDKDGKIAFPETIHRIFSTPSAFKSVSIENDVKKHAVCPFKNAAAGALTTEFDPNTGQQTGRIHGGIIIAIMAKYRELESDRPAEENLRYG